MSLPNTEENTGGKGQVKAKEKDPREERYWRVQKKQKLGEEGKREEKKRRRKRWNQKLFFIFFILLTLLGMDSTSLMSAVALPRLIWPKFSARDSWIKIWRRKTEKEKKKDEEEERSKKKGPTFSWCQRAAALETERSQSWDGWWSLSHRQQLPSTLRTSGTLPVDLLLRSSESKIHASNRMYLRLFSADDLHGALSMAL